MAAGLIAEAVGHDQIPDLGGIGRALPMTVFAFGLAGLSLMGVPPSGGFVAKWMLLSATVMEGQWWWAVIMLLGGLLAGGYVFMVLGKALSTNGSLTFRVAIPRHRQVIVLAVALCAVLLGLMPLQPSGLLMIGRPEMHTNVLE
jgi:formate hydrogenlyase subunit 3/multisubunit Na+/H+ antiporter MnhD subunit